MGGWKRPTGHREGKPACCSKPAVSFQQRGKRFNTRCFVASVNVNVFLYIQIKRPVNKVLTLLSAVHSSKMNPNSLQIFILGLVGGDWLSAKVVGRRTEQPNLTCISRFLLFSH